MKLPLWIISPHESAEIVKMISEGEISRASGLPKQLEKGK